MGSQAARAILAGLAARELTPPEARDLFVVIGVSSAPRSIRSRRARGRCEKLQGIWHLRTQK
jgi:hypothetical protein